MGLSAASLMCSAVIGRDAAQLSSRATIPYFPPSVGSTSSHVLLFQLGVDIDICDTGDNTVASTNNCMSGKSRTLMLASPPCQHRFDSTTVMTAAIVAVKTLESLSLVIILAPRQTGIRLGDARLYAHNALQLDSFRRVLSSKSFLRNTIQGAS